MKEKKISEIAYFLWQEAGCPENKDLDFWLAAEKKYKLLQTFENNKTDDVAQFKRIYIPLIKKLKLYPKLINWQSSSSYQIDPAVLK
jgi:hypothetical protein